MNESDSTSSATTDVSAHETAVSADAVSSMRVSSETRIITWLRRVAMVEGVSFLLLLLAMPLKYMADWPWGVRYVGMAHGVLFLALLAMLVIALCKTRLTMLWAAAVFIASLLPFGPFVIDHRLKQFED